MHGVCAHTQKALFSKGKGNSDDCFEQSSCYRAMKAFLDQGVQEMTGTQITIGFFYKLLRLDEREIDQGIDIPIVHVLLNDI